MLMIIIASQNLTLADFSLFRSRYPLTRVHTLVNSSSWSKPALIPLWGRGLHVLEEDEVILLLAKIATQQICIDGRQVTFSQDWCAGVGL